MRAVARFAKQEVEAKPEVKRLEGPPSQQQLEVAAGWLTVRGVPIEHARMAVGKAVADALSDGREWVYVLQGFVNKAIRENWPAYQRFSGNWLMLREAINQVRELEVMLDEAHA